MRRLRVRPSPVPSLDEADRSPCWKESKMRSWSAGSMPMPVSVTVTSISSPSRQARTVDAPAVRRELHGVAQQVEHHLLESQLVGA